MAALISVSSGSLWALVVIATPGTAHQVTKERDRIVLGKHPDHLPFLVEREVKILEAFLPLLAPWSSVRPSAPARQFVLVHHLDLVWWRISPVRVPKTRLSIARRPGPDPVLSADLSCVLEAGKLFENHLDLELGLERSSHRCHSSYPFLGLLY